MPTIRFNAPPHHALEATDPASDREVRIAGGGTADVSDQLAEELATAPYCDVEIVDGEPAFEGDFAAGGVVPPTTDSVQETVEIETDEDLSKLNRPELNDLAKQVGVEDPEYLPNRDAVIDEIHAAQKPEAEGAGLSDDNDSEED